MVVLVKRENKYKDKWDKDTVENKKTSRMIKNTSIFIAYFVVGIILITGLSSVASAFHAGVIPHADLIQSYTSIGGTPEYKDSNIDLAYKVQQGDTLTFSITLNPSYTNLECEWTVRRGSAVLTSATGTSFSWTVPSEDSTWEIEAEVVSQDAVGNPVGKDTVSWSITTVDVVTVNPGESIQEAIDSLPPEGGVVELAAGTYYLPLGGTITLTLHTNGETPYTPIQVEDLPDGTHHWIGYKDYKYAIILNERHNITIRGAGINDTILINAGESYPEYHMIFIVKGSNNIIEDLSIKNNYTGWIPDDAGNGIQIFGKAENTTISNIKAERFPAGIDAGVTLHALKRYHAIENLTISNCLLTHNKQGIAYRYTYNSTITNCEISDSWAGNGIDSNEGCSYNIIENTIAHDNANAGIKIYDGSWGNVVRNNICYRNGEACGPGIWVFSSVDSIVTNNICRDNYHDGITILSQYSPPDNTTVSHNLVYNNKGHGIWIHASRDVRTDLNPPYDTIIESNTIYNNSGDGIVHGLEQNLELYNITVKNNIITNNGGYGINHGGNESQSQLILSYNDIWGNALGNYNGTSAGTGDISEDPLFADPDNDDFHLKSSGGRWTPNGWVYTDTEDSPCIDKGDPDEDCYEPLPNGGRINMGAYGW